jgi:hypothetical protein
MKYESPRKEKHRKRKNGTQEKKQAAIVAA